MPLTVKEERLPVIMYGALRSGTTLFRLILNHHPALSGPGETDFLLDHIQPDQSHPTGWRYDREALASDRVFRAQEIILPVDLDGKDLFDTLVDALWAKAPDRRLILVFHRNAEKLAALLPKGPILHLLRDPRDVGRSSIGMGWAGNSYYGVRHWIGTETEWGAAAIADQRVHDITFEALMHDIRGELLRVCNFLGLPFSENMLTYPENSTYAPPDPKIAQQWKRKAGEREIALMESAVGPLLEARGYEAYCTPQAPNGFECTWLAVENRVKRWRFNIRRYGVLLFFGLHATQFLGMRRIAAILAKRQEEILIRNLK